MPFDIGGFVYNTAFIQDYAKGGIVTDGLVLHLDAAYGNSYPKGGTTWYDLSGNGNNFSVNASAYNPSFGGYFDFNGSYGMAKNSSDISLSDSNGVTYYLVTRVKQSTSDWRTLTRSYISDHHVIIQSGAWNLGMYDNDNSGFLDSGFDQTSLPNYGTSYWVFMYFRWQSTSPYYSFSYNDTPSTIRGSITNSNSRYNRGFGAIGGYHGESTNVNVGSQFWGDIAIFNVYNRFLSDSELLQNYNAQKSRFGL